MSWLRDHFHHFVFPAFVASRNIPNATKIDIRKCFPVSLPEVPSDKWTNLPTELRKLNALVESLPKNLFLNNSFGEYATNTFSGYES